jgi:acetamidase/formamidase
LTAAVVTNQIDVAGISLAPRLFAAVRQNMNLRLSQTSTPRYDPLDPRTAARIIESGRVHACSLAADFRVTQMVNMAKGAHCMLPKSILG